MWNLMVMGPLDAALGYAQRGWHVHPLKPRSKAPATEHGFKDASTDTAVITDWWTNHPDLNVGIATGAGLYVLDVDGPEGELSLLKLQRVNGGLPATREARTGKGRHLFFTHKGEIGNSASKLGKGLDFRGDGGYVAVAPSIHPDGTQYAWVKECDPLPLPVWISDALTATTWEPTFTLQRAKGRVERLAPDQQCHRYVAPILRNALEALAHAPTGTRNHKLNEYACRMGHWIPTGGIDRGYLEDELLSVALSIGLTQMESIKTIESGITEGMREPKQVPDKDFGSVAPFETDKAQVLRKTPGVIEIKRGSAFGRRKVNFFWGDRIPLGKLTILAGPAKLGKSYTTVALAAAVTAGKPLPDDKGQTLRGEVLFCSYEDDVEDTIGWRCDDLGVDMDKMHFITKVTTPNGDRQFGPQDVPDIVDYVRANPQIKLIVIDPLGSFMGGAVDANAENQTRAVLSTLTDAAQDTGAGIVMVAHFKKSEASSVIHQISGSQGISAISRSVLVVGEHDGEMAIAHAAHNLSGKAATVVYRIEQGKFYWDRVAKDLDAEIITAAKDRRTRAPGAGRPVQHDREHDDLVDELQRLVINSPNGRAKVEAIKAWRDRNCLSERTWDEVRRDAKVRYDRVSGEYEMDV